MSAVPEPLFDMTIDDDGNIVQSGTNGVQFKEDGLTVGDVLMELNGRKLGGLKKKQILVMLRELLKPLAANQVSKSLDAVPNGQAGSKDDVLLDQSTVILNWIVYSRLTGLKVSYAQSAGKFKYNEIRM